MKQLFLVALREPEKSKAPHINGFLAFQWVKGRKLRVCAYTRGQAIKKAHLFNGRIVPLETWEA